VVIEPKDYLNFRLTGRIASDRVSMARLAAAAAPGPNGRSLLEAAGLDPLVLPSLHDPTDVIGLVQPGQPLAGVPVLAMAHDTWSSVVGFGALRPGFAYNISGTTDVIGVLDADASSAPEGLMHVHWSQGLTQIGGPSQAGGDTLAWLMSLLGEPGSGPALDHLAQQPRDAAPLLFLPYLSGERTPYWDVDLRGAFIGLNRRHGAADLLRAVMEGVAFLNRIVLERARAMSNSDITELRFGGGGAASAEWCQIKADVLGLRVVVPRGGEHGLIGAAIAALTTLGDFPTLAAAQAHLARPGLVYEPDPVRHAASTRLFAIFREAEVALRPISHTLANWHGG
jgi:xylulokinase